MAAILDLAKQHPVQEFGTGETIIEQNTTTGRLYVLMEGEVEVLKNDVRISKVSGHGILFGEIAALLGGAHTATVLATKPSSFAVIENPRAFLQSCPEASLEVAELLASRVQALSGYLVDVKRQYAGHDHLGMVDEVLEALIQQPLRREKARTSSANVVG